LIAVLLFEVIQVVVPDNTFVQILGCVVCCQEVEVLWCQSVWSVKRKSDWEKGNFVLALPSSLVLLSWF
jgi:hypothetical protein